MNNAVDAIDDLFDLRQVGDIGLHEGGIAGEIGRRTNVAEAKLRIDPFEQAAQPRADSARGPCHQYCLHGTSLALLNPSHLRIVDDRRFRLSVSDSGGGYW